MCFMLCASEINSNGGFKQARVPMATELSRVLSFLDELLPIKLHDSLIV